VVRPAAPAPDRPSLQPVLAHLTAADGRHFARSSAGQWLTVAAVAYGSGHDEAGDLARVGARQARSTRLPARPELAALARVLAHQQDAVGR
jgi:hypothetical protein